MKNKVGHIIELLKSWESGYLPSSAQMVMKNAREIIIEQDQIIIDLQDQIKELESSTKKPKAKKDVKEASQK